MCVAYIFRSFYICQINGETYPELHVDLHLTIRKQHLLLTRLYASSSGHKQTTDPRLADPIQAV